MTIKLKKHSFCSYWQINFMSDTDKRTLIDLYEISIAKNLKQGSSNLLDVRIK